MAWGGSAQHIAPVDSCDTNLSFAIQEAEPKLLKSQLLIICILFAAEFTKKNVGFCCAGHPPELVLVRDQLLGAQGN